MRTGKERQRGTLIVQGKVKCKGEGCKDDLRCHQGGSVIGSVLIYQLVTYSMPFNPSKRIILNILWFSSFQNKHTVIY